LTVLFQRGTYALAFESAHYPGQVALLTANCHLFVGIGGEEEEFLGHGIHVKVKAGKTSCINIIK
jgi:predicted glycosyltransferase involved in capsule biosynthesis